MDNIAIANLIMLVVKSVTATTGSALTPEVETQIQLGLTEAALQVAAQDARGFARAVALEVISKNPVGSKETPKEYAERVYQLTDAVILRFSV